MEAIRKERVDAAVREVQGQEDGQSTGDGTQSSTTEDIEQRRQEAATAAASLPIDEADVEVEGWEGKGRWVFYLDLTTDFCKLVIYLSFFFILLIFYGLPLHIMRDVFLTCRSFIKRIGDFMRYRTATRDMNERYPDATEAEIGENECIICREEMRPYVPPAPGTPADPLTERMRPKKLPCGHVLHFACLRSWLERQQICPTCRATVVPAAQAPQGAPAAAPGAPARAQHPQNAGNGRPRVFQIGPLRIGIGAARGNNMFEELQEQLANLNALPPPPVPAQNANGPQQYGFGIRWDGIRRRAQGHRAPRGSVQDQLDSIERQIQREVDSLQTSMSDLQALRDIQGQLTRIRMARQGVPVQPPLPTANQIAPLGARPTAGPTVTSLTGQPQQGILQAGSEHLPTGLTLPEGWTMMPLQPMQAQPIQSSMVFHNPAIQPNMPVVPQIPQVPEMHIAVPHEPQVEVQQPDAEPTLANILRETREVLRSTTPDGEASQERSGDQPSNRDPLAESIRLQREVEQSRARMAELTGQLRGIGQTIANTTVDGQTPSTNIPRAQPSSAHMQATSRQNQMGSNAPQSPSSTMQSILQARQRQHPEQGRQPVASPQSRSLQSPSQQAPIGIAPPQSAPQMARSVPSTIANSGAISRPSTGSSVSPPRQLAPSSRVNNNNPTGNRTRSPHRPTRSIGSSWGFSGVEQNKGDGDDNDDDEDHEDEDTTDSDEDEETKSISRKTNGPPSKSNATNNRSRTSTSTTHSAKSKNPTVEDLVEDPD